MTRIGVGLVGYGLAGRVFHAPLIAAAPDLELRAIVTADRGRRAQAESDFPEAVVVSGPEQLWTRPIELVVVATPNHLHFPNTMSALEQGRHVVVDKPMALNSEEAIAMIERASSSGRLLTVFQNRRYDNDFLLLRRLLAADELGGLLHLESRFERWRPELHPGSWREELSPEAGGGLLLDLGSHLIDQALQLLGTPTAVYSELAVRRPGAVADDDDFVALQFSGGRSAHLWMSAVAPVAGPRFRAWGRVGALETFGLDPQEGQLRSGLRPGHEGYGQATGQQVARLSKGGPAIPVGLPPGGYPEFYSAVARAIRGGGEVPVAASAGLEALAVVEAARVSAAAGREVGLG
ncbi:MAG: Gfo/Idh/MocA family oxidoreductase, partial [Candidatus Dormibacteraeota bacterium]|nr:Gfo/Idh/MocA family oxidoreductase [Candidatus Dormibacteraeota bacterium]